jgi:predicted nucleic acid-binding Zn ribbon protein
MPLFEWSCPKCNWSVEMLGVQPKTVECPMCAEDGIKSEMIRLFPRSSFILKGDGWTKK